MAAAIIFSLQFLAAHARDRAHASGTAAVRASITIPLTPTTKTLGVGYRRGGFPSAWGRLARAVEPATTYVPIDELAEPGPGLVAAAARLHQALGHSFGVPELPQLTLDGEFDWRFWDHDRRPRVKAWAGAAGVKINGLPKAQ